MQCGAPGVGLFRESFIEALASEKGLKVCMKHPEEVRYDERECPACSLMAEMSKTMWNRPKVKA